MTISDFLNLAIPVLLGGLSGLGVAFFWFGQYKHKVDTLEKHVERLQEEYKELMKQVTEVSTKIDERTQNLASTLTKRKSPISLNEKGEGILSRSGSDKFVLENKDELVKKIKDKDPKSAYDVQVYAKEVVEGLQNEDRFTPFKDFVYKEGIEIDSIFIVMSIYLRDIALPLLGYTKEEVDKTDPHKKKNEEAKA